MVVGWKRRLIYTWNYYVVNFFKKEECSVFLFSSWRFLDIIRQIIICGKRMFFVILNTFLESISEVFYKKSLLTSRLRPTVFQFAFELLGIVFVSVLLACFGFKLELLSDWKIWAGFTVLSACYTLYSNIAQKLYREEKMSVTIPFFKINNFFLIIAGFFLFHDASVIFLLVCLFSLGIVVGGSFDFKHREFPKNIWLILLHEALRTIEMIVIVSILRRVTNVEYMVLYQGFYLVLAFFMVLFLRQFSDLKLLDWTTIRNRSFSYTLWFAYYFIDTFLLQEYGLIVTTLFSFFGSSISLALAYALFREVPEKKEIFI